MRDYKNKSCKLKENKNPKKICYNKVAKCLQFIYFINTVAHMLITYIHIYASVNECVYVCRGNARVGRPLVPPLMS